MLSIKISEIFYSIQGEGTTQGCPSVFIRLAGCNLNCRGTWVCDSVEQWKHANLSLNGRELTEYLKTTDHLFDAIQAGARLVITGGEPLLQQKALLEFFKELTEQCNGLPFVEVETNGTLEPLIQFNTYVTKWNVSPKLLNSGLPVNQRVNDNAIKFFANCSNQVEFKFVVATETDVKDAIETFIKPFGLNSWNICLMPAADNKKQLDEITPEVIRLCKKYFYPLCYRLQIAVWDREKGV